MLLCEDLEHPCHAKERVSTAYDGTSIEPNALSNAAYFAADVVQLVRR